MKEVEELAGRLARVQGGKTVNKNTERMYGARRTLHRVRTVHVVGRAAVTRVTEGLGAPWCTEGIFRSTGSVRGCSRAWFL
jgi:hypothetical protein